MKKVQWFIFSAGVLLMLTAVAKFITGAGSVHILQYPAPILSISLRHFLRIVGTFELVVALVCFFGRRIEIKAVLVAWLATSFLVYRLGLLWIGYHQPCPCLGNLTDALHIPPQTADLAMEIILAYLFIGSYAALFWLWRQRKTTPPNPPAPA